MFDLNLSRYSEWPCLITDDDTISYKEVENLCLRIENALPTEKQLILVKAKTNVETIIGYLTFLRSNNAFIIIDADVDDRFIENIIETYRPNFIWEESTQNDKYLIKYKNYGLKENNLKNLECFQHQGQLGHPKWLNSQKQIYM